MANFRSRRTGRESLHTRVVQDKRPKAIEKFVRDEICQDTSGTTEELEDWEDRNMKNVTLRGLECTHPRMKYCCPKPCGHLECPDCGLDWDEGANK